VHVLLVCFLTVTDTNKWILVFKQFLSQILGSQLKAIAATFVLSVIPLFGLPFQWLGYLLALIYIHQHGFKKSWQVILAAILPTLAFGILDNQLFLMNLMTPLTIFSMHALLRRLHCWMTVVEVFTLIGSLVILVLHWLMPDVTAQLKNALMGTLNLVELQHLNSLQAKKAVQVFVPVAIGFLILSTFINSLLVNFISEHMTTYLGIKTLPIHANQPLSVLMTAVMVVVMILAWYFKWASLIDILPVFLIAFILPAMQLAHLFFRQLGKKKWLIILFYLAMALLLPYSLILFMVITFFDAFFDFRNKWFQTS
jgi:hypothetical protein